MAEEATWQTLVLIPKGKKEYRVIGLVEVMWKVVAAILHRRLTTAITYHKTRFPGGSRYWDSHPRGQAAPAACSREVGSPVRDLPGPDQGVQHLGQVQEPGDIVRVRGGTTSETAAAGVLEKVHDDGTGGRVFRDRFQGREGSDTGRPTVTLHIQCGGGCGGYPLGHAGSGGGRDAGGQGREGRDQAGLFYADDGMVSSSNPRWLQWAFNTLVGLFDRVGLHTNVGKTVSMICRPCPTAGNQLEVAYGQKMTGEGLTYRERKRERVKCGDCGKGMAAGSLDAH